jgi:uroporphyrinogen-III decarboxylase
MIRLFIAKTFLNCLVPVVMSVLKRFSKRKPQAVCVQDSQATNESVSLITEMIIRVQEDMSKVLNICIYTSF